MLSRKLCMLTLVLWILGALVLGWLFIRGWTTAGSDGRTEIVLAPSERDEVLAQMRQFLQGLHAVLAHLGESDPSQGLKAAEVAARKVGMAADQQANPVLMVKLPQSFKHMGMAVHQEFDRLADGIAQGETAPQIIRRLSTITSQCTTCHEMYRLSARP